MTPLKHMQIEFRPEGVMPVGVMYAAQVQKVPLNNDWIFWYLLLMFVGFVWKFAESLVHRKQDKNSIDWFNAYVFQPLFSSISFVIIYKIFDEIARMSQSTFMGVSFSEIIGLCLIGFPALRIYQCFVILGLIPKMKPLESGVEAILTKQSERIDDSTKDNDNEKQV